MTPKKPRKGPRPLARRAGGCALLTLGLVFVVPLLLPKLLVFYEETQGISLYDPSLGGDPIAGPSDASREPAGILASLGAVAALVGLFLLVAPARTARRHP